MLGAGRHWAQVSGGGVRKRYVTLWERSTDAIRPAFSGPLSLAIAATAAEGEGEREDQKVYLIEIL